VSIRDTYSKEVADLLWLSGVPLGDILNSKHTTNRDKIIAIKVYRFCNDCLAAADLIERKV